MADRLSRSEALYASVEKAIPSMSPSHQPEMYAMLAKARAAGQETAKAWQRVEGAEAALRTSRTMTHALPKGISSGRIAAYVAAAAVVVGGIHLLTRPKPEAASWQSRIDAERAMQAQDRGV